MSDADKPLDFDLAKLAAVEYKPRHEIIPLDIEHAYARVLDFGMRNAQTFILAAQAGNFLRFKEASQAAFKMNDLQASARMAYHMETYEELLSNPDIFISVIAADA